MADFVLNIAAGRFAELYNRVDTNDPTNAALIIAVFNVTGGVSAEDAALRDADTIAAIEALANVAEATNGSYARKTLTDADIVAFAPDDTNNRVDVDIPDQTWTGIAAGDAWMKLVIAYDNDTTGGADSAIVPMTAHDFAVTPDGSDITATIATAGFARATPS
jgi:hypothetical protein